VNNYIIKEMTEEYAKKICNWKYKKEYDVYNLTEHKVTLEVRTFNKRAIKCYLDFGFEIKDKFIKDTFDGKDEFYYMEY